MNGDHNMQTAVAYKAVLDNTQVTGPDYDKIKDKLGAEKSSEKLHLEDKSLELTKSSNDYFTLMPQEECDSTSKLDCDKIMLNNCYWGTTIIIQRKVYPML